MTWLRWAWALFVALVCLNVGVQAAILALAVERGSWCPAAVAGLVFVVWLVVMVGPWRPGEVDRTWWRGFGEVDEKGFSGFGLAQGVVVPWAAVRRVTFTHAELVGKYRYLVHRPKPTWARVETETRRSG